jgi:uncharacterized membrane protein YwzB
MVKHIPLPDLTIFLEIVKILLLYISLVQRDNYSWTKVVHYIVRIIWDYVVNHFKLCSLSYNRLIKITIQFKVVHYIVRIIWDYAINYFKLSSLNYNGLIKITRTIQFKVVHHIVRIIWDYVVDCFKLCRLS